ncbi:hydroxymethylbilane synthase [Cellulosimicrobium marinum]|uniref:hydroxymethylbilane synthase n=1 Tax=Cellulosimicrobium marinum TaxID=1638992 RepID=UPI001E5BF575|nr:hydroxymethylbilane synthase [Cellulosimicrobium marinum]MCB7135667.1 hydroxymethylbilane synthase [Cellulosimicrobium marinum]
MSDTPTTSPAPGTTTGAALRIGTRGSALATTQTGLVARRLAELTGRDVETVRVRTEGDVLTGSLAQMGGTGVFVTALREALLAGRVDVAVHSLKDLPTAAAPGLTVVTPEREDPRDALCARDGFTVATLPRGARVGTGSPRRAAQLRAVRPDLDVVDIRGNVGTRLARVHGEDADLDAVVLAYAGLARLGLLDEVTEVVDVAVMAPAAGQGALAVEVRTPELDDPVVAAALDALDHEPTRLAVLAERSLLARLEAGCAAPVGTHAVVEGDTLSLTAVVARVDGAEQLSHAARTALPAPGPGLRAARDDAALLLGERVADALLADGAARLAALGPAADRASTQESALPGAGGTPPGDTTAVSGTARGSTTDAVDPAVEAAREQLRDGGYRGEGA